MCVRIALGQRVKAEATVDTVRSLLGEAGDGPVRKAVTGAVAQLDEHLLCTEKDAGSSPVCSTTPAPTTTRGGGQSLDLLPKSVRIYRDH